MRALEEADVVAGEFLLELVDGGNGGVGECGDAEEGLVAAGVVLAAGGAEGGGVGTKRGT